MLTTEFKKIIIFAIFWCTVLVAFYFFFWHPSLNNLKEMQDKINLQQNALAQIRKDAETWPKTVTAEKLKAAEAELQKFLAQIPSEEDIPGILAQIQKYGVSANLNIVGITNVTDSTNKSNLHRISKSEDKRSKSADAQSSQEDNGTTYAKVTYKLVAHGSFYELIYFLRGLETAERLIIIEDLDFKRIDSASTTNPNFAEIDFNFVRSLQRVRGASSKVKRLENSVDAEITLSMFYSS